MNSELNTQVINQQVGERDNLSTSNASRLGQMVLNAETNIKETNQKVEHYRLYRQNTAQEPSNWSELLYVPEILTNNLTLKALKTAVWLKSRLS